ncbi:hypothetical protein [Tateyamaria sp.]|uniref:hypothetical protein n=1 Tax=Tateyamaria sp. TaxID=1929288 RepID=UPI00329D6A43
MNSSELSTTKSSKFNSTLFKTVLAAALAMLCVVATKSMLSGQGSRDLVLSAQSDRVSSITELLALQSGGALKSGNQLAVSKSIEGVLDAAQPDMLGALVVNSAGVILHETKGENLQTPENLALVHPCSTKSVPSRKTLDRSATKRLKSPLLLMICLVAHKGRLQRLRKRPPPLMS